MFEQYDQVQCLDSKSDKMKRRKCPKKGIGYMKSQSIVVTWIKAKLACEDENMLTCLRIGSTDWSK